MKNIIIYTDETCSSCKMLKDYLLIQGLSYNEVSINSPSLPENIKNIKEVPIIIVDEKCIIGFRVNVLNKIFNIKNFSSAPIYLDFAASSPINKSVLKKMNVIAKKYWANPSSNHNLGYQCDTLIENCRQEIKACIGAKKGKIIFTSGGSESNNLIIKSIVNTRNSIEKVHIITSCIEHSSVLNTCCYLESQGHKITYLPVDTKGSINLQALLNAITPETAVISIMAANNELGTIQQIRKIGHIAKKNKILFHVDAVQAIGHIKIDVTNQNIDALSISAHKFGGPKGIGALYVNNYIALTPLIHGGNQEYNYRAGTQNIAGIVGITEALKIRTKNIENDNKRILYLRRFFISELKKNFKSIQINGNSKYYLPNILNITFSEFPESRLLLLLEMFNIYASAASACCSKNNKESYVLKAIGKTKEEINNTIRFSFNYETEEKELAYVIDILKKIDEGLNNNISS